MRRDLIQVALLGAALLMAFPASNRATACEDEFISMTGVFDPSMLVAGTFPQVEGLRPGTKEPLRMQKFRLVIQIWGMTANDFEDLMWEEGERQIEMAVSFYDWHTGYPLPTDESKERQQVDIGTIKGERDGKRGLFVHFPLNLEFFAHIMGEYVERFSETEEDHWNLTDFFPKGPFDLKFFAPWKNLDNRKAKFSWNETVRITEYENRRVEVGSFDPFGSLPDWTTVCWPVVRDSTVVRSDTFTIAKVGKIQPDTPESSQLKVCGADGKPDRTLCVDAWLTAVLSDVSGCP